MSDAETRWKAERCGDGYMHVFPLGDLREHTFEDFSCWCRPWDDCGIIVHNSMDGREKFERGERQAS